MDRTSPALASLTREQLLKLDELQELAGRHGVALVALPAREAQAVIDVINFARERVNPNDIHMPYALRAAGEIADVIAAGELWNR